jgi:hypothetical protein
VLTAILSAFINSNYGYQAVLSLRLVIRFYFLYLAIINLDLQEEKIYTINNILIFLFILQLPTQALKFYFYGFSEDTIGTYGTHGGGLTTVIPLVALGYLIAFYCIYKKSIYYLILCGWFIAYGIIGLKLALFFLYPISFFSLYYINVIKIKGIRITRDAYRIIIIAILIIGVGAIIIKHQARTNRERTVGGSVDLSYALKSSLDYTTRSRSSNEELALGRVATTKMTLKYLLEEGFVNFCFGYGPGVINKHVHYTSKKKYATRVEKIAGSYGKTGAVYILSEYGIIGLILIIIIYSFFIKNCWKLYTKEKETYWKAFASGSFFFACVTFFIFITYNHLTVMGDTIVPVFFYCMAIVQNRNNALKKINDVC